MAELDSSVRERCMYTHGYPSGVAENEQPEPMLNLALPADQAGGVWANYAQVTHSPFEFTIDFARIDFSQATPDALPGVVVARVNLSPLLVSQLLDALKDNWDKYAERAMPREVRGDEH